MSDFLRTSERNLFKKCQWAWERSYVDKLKLDRQESMALWFGTGIHLALEKWYIPGTVRGRDPRGTWREYVNESRADTDYVNTYKDGEFDEAVSALELGEDMLTQYLDEYGTEEHLEVISAEQTFQVPIRHPSWEPGENVDPEEDRKRMEQHGDITTYVGTFDMVVRDLRDNKLYVWDHKTAAQLGSANTQYLPLDDQAGAYWAIATYTLRKQGLIGPKEHIEGVVYNYLRKAKADTRPKNADGHSTNKPQKKHYVQTLTHRGIESPDDKKPLDKLTVAVLESLAEEHGITVLGEVSSSQPPKNLDRVTVYRHRKQMRSQIERIQNDLEAMSLVRNNLVPTTKTPTRECGFCEFREICELDESGKDYSDFVEQIYTTWDPYEAHRDKESQ